MAQLALLASDPALGAYLLRTLVSLVVVLCLAALCAVLAKRFLPQLSMPAASVVGDGEGEIRILESKRIDRTRRVCLIEVGERRFLVALGPEQVESLGSWSQEGVLAKEGSDA